MEPKTKHFFASVKAIDRENRTLDAVASTSELDRDKDIILPSAFVESLGAFKANPVILACHQHRLSSGSSPVIGSAIPESIKVNKKDVAFTMRFAKTPLGEEYWQLYSDSHMKAFSIGFIPIEYVDEKDEELGYIRTYTKIELLEISAVPVPSNRQALARAKELFGGGETDQSEDIKTLVSETKADVKKRFDNIQAAIKESTEKVTAAIENCADDIKSLLITDQGEFAERVLGRSSEQLPSGDEEKTERIAVIITNAIKNLNTSKE